MSVNSFSCFEYIDISFDPSILQNLLFLFKQVQQANVDDEEIARAINSKLGETPGISYSEIASKAVDCGRTQLAIKVSLEHSHVNSLIIDHTFSGQFGA